VSSANLTSALPTCIGWRSDAVTTTGNCDWLSQRLQESFWQALSPHAFQHWRSGLVTKHGEQQDLSTGLQPTTSTSSYCAPPFSIGTRWSLPFSLRESRRLNHSVQVFSTSLSRHHLTEQNHNTPAVTGHAHSWAWPVTAVRYSTEVPKTEEDVDDESLNGHTIT